MPAVEKKYTVVGISMHKGNKTFRFATGNPTTREGVLKRNGHEDIKLFQCPELTKMDAIAWLEKEHPSLARSALMPAGRKLKTAAELRAEIEEAAKPKEKKARGAKAKAKEGETAAA